MGNCQAIDTATISIQHPSGKIDNFYMPMIASDVMKMNPGHHVALLISTSVYPNPTHHNNPAAAASAASATTTTTTVTNNNPSTVRVTKIKLLRPTDTLVLGQIYRLITNQEVMRGKKSSKINKIQPQSTDTERLLTNSTRSQLHKANNQVVKHERHQPKTVTSTNSNSNSAPAKSRTWQPSLISISEASS